PDKHKDLCWADIKDSESVVVAGQRYWSFWPENEDIGQLMDLWEIDEYTFLSQYMQEPIALSGHVFNADWFKWYGSEENPHPPYWEFRFITADTATKTGTRNDFSVMCEWGVYLGNLYLINMVRGKWEAPELLSTFSAFASECWNKNQKQELGNLRAILIEDASSGTGLIQSFGRESPVPVTPIKRQKDKLTRAMDSCPHIKAGKVYLPEGVQWIVEFVSEVSMFTADDSHRHDDQTDNLMDAIDYALIKNTSLFDMIYR
ncbi:MAG: phage terminase large subunit, partial [Shewanella sp.]